MASSRPCLFSVYFLLLRRDPLFDRIHDTVAAGFANGEEHALLLVVADERRGLFIVGIKPFGDGLHCLVRALDRGAAALLALVPGRRRIALDIVDLLARCVGEAVVAGTVEVQDPRRTSLYPFSPLTFRFFRVRRFPLLSP